MKFYAEALRCFMLDFLDLEIRCAVSTNAAVQHAVHRAAKTNITSVMGSRVTVDKPYCHHLLGKLGGRVCMVHSVRGEEVAGSKPGEPSLLAVLQASAATKEDIFYVNFGRWHFNNCKGLQADTYTQSLTELGVFYEATKGTFPNLFYKTTNHDHTPCAFDSKRVIIPPSGQPHLLVSDSMLSSSSSSSSSSSEPGSFSELELMQDKFAPSCPAAGAGNYSLALYDIVWRKANEILGKYGVPVINDYALSRQLHSAHWYRGKRGWDCNHYCSPGLPEFEIYTMTQAFKKHGVQQLQGRNVQAMPPCVPPTKE